MLACDQSHWCWEDVTFRDEIERAEEGDDTADADQVPATVAQIRETFGTTDPKAAA